MVRVWHGRVSIAGQRLLEMQLMVEHICEFLKKGASRDPKGYRGIIRGLYRAPLRDYVGVISKTMTDLGFRTKCPSTWRVIGTSQVSE